MCVCVCVCVYTFLGLRIDGCLSSVDGGWEEAVAESVGRFDRGGSPVCACVRV